MAIHMENMKYIITLADTYCSIHHTGTYTILHYYCQPDADYFRLLHIE